MRRAIDTVASRLPTLWPAPRATAGLLVALLALQAGLFFAATSTSFFTHEDFYHFAIGRRRTLLHYLVTPIIHTYPAPGHRLLFFLLDTLWPMNYAAARLILLALLAATTFLLAWFVRTLARSDQWWTVALLTPFALSLTLVGPVNLWSNGVPVLPALLFTVVALAAWTRSYAGPHPAFWVGATVLAIAAAGAFYTKFVLIPFYLAFFRVFVFPHVLGLSVGVGHLWRERNRWIAVCVPPALFLAVYTLSGLAARSYIPGSRPYAAYLVTAWFGALVPVVVLNVPLEASTAANSWWALTAISQLLLVVVVVFTCRRSRLAVRAWLFFLLLSVVQLVMVGSARLPGFGVNIAYWLRYYPEIVLFVPIVLAMGLRQGAERRPDVAFEHTRAGLAAIGMFACMHVAGLAAWAPRIVSESDGARARVWVDHLRDDLAAIRQGPTPLRLVDAEVPDFIVLSWMEPYNRLSTVLDLLGIDALYNEVGHPLYAVLPDGHVRPAAFRSVQRIVLSATHRSPDATTAGAVEPGGERCVDETGWEYRPPAGLAGARLALRISYGRPSREPATLEVETDDPDRPSRYLTLLPSRHAAEIVDLAAATVLAIRVKSARDDRVCVSRIEVGSLAP